MINLFDEIVRIAGLPVETVFSDYRYVVIGGHTCYIEQHKGIYMLDKDEIVINLRRARLSVRGADLAIKRLTKTDIVITGGIMSTLIEPM